MSGVANQNPAGYVGILSILVETAREHGYALGLHGSLARDMDLIAVPWVEDARPAEFLIAAIADRVAWLPTHGVDGPENKPHGRRAWSIALGHGARIDISVTPAVASGTTTEEW